MTLATLCFWLTEFSCSGRWQGDPYRSVDTPAHYKRVASHMSKRVAPFPMVNSYNPSFQHDVESRPQTPRQRRARFRTAAPPLSYRSNTPSWRSRRQQPAASAAATPGEGRKIKHLPPSVAASHFRESSSNPFASVVHKSSQPLSKSLPLASSEEQVSPTTAGQSAASDETGPSQVTPPRLPSAQVPLSQAAPAQVSPSPSWSRAQLARVASPRPSKRHVPVAEVESPPTPKRKTTYLQELEHAMVSSKVEAKADESSP